MNKTENRSNEEAILLLRRLYKEVQQKSSDNSLILPMFKYSGIFFMFYKHISYNFADYLENEILFEKEFTLTEAYSDEKTFSEMKESSLNSLGYFFTSPDYLFGEIALKSGEGDFFYNFKNLEEGIVCQKDTRLNSYFKEIFSDAAFYLDNSFFRDNEEIFLKQFSIIDNLHMDGSPDFKGFFSLFTILFFKDSDNGAILLNLAKGIKKDISSVLNPFMGIGNFLTAFSDETVTVGIEEEKLLYSVSKMYLIMKKNNVENLNLSNENNFQYLNQENESFDLIISDFNSESFNSKYTRFKNSFLENYSKLKNSEFEKILNKKLSTLKTDLKITNEFKKIVNESFNDLAYQNMEKFFSKEEYKPVINSDYYCLIEMFNLLNDEGIMAVSMPQGFLGRNKDSVIRKYFTEELNAVDVVINFDFIYLTDIPVKVPYREVILIFKKNRDSDKTLFIDGSGLESDNLLKIYSEYEEIENISKLVSLEEISDNGFNLSLSRYINNYKGEYIKLEDVLEQKRELNQKLDRINSGISYLMNKLV